MTNTPRIRTTTEIADEIVDGLSDPWGSPIAGDVIAGTKKRIEEALDLERKRAEGLVGALEKIQYGSKLPEIELNRPKVLRMEIARQNKIASEAIAAYKQESS